MSKKPQRQEKSDSAEAAAPEAVNNDVPEPSPGNGKPETPLELGSSSVLDEVQAFFHQREELAEKLAKEIEATEAKLAELTLTMSQLFPDRPTNPGKDRKAKKPRKSPPRSQAEANDPKSAQGRVTKARDPIDGGDD